MRKHDKNKTRMLEYTYTVTFILIYQIYTVIILYHIFYIVILFYISKTSNDNKQTTKMKLNGRNPNILRL